MRLFSKYEDSYLFLIFLLMAIGVLVKSFFAPHGYLTVDSSVYLSLAQNLIEGNGFYIYHNLAPSSEKTIFVVWPIGYPLLIYLIAKPFGIPVFWASKIVNILCFGASLLLLRKLFQKSAYLYGLVFFSASSIVVFTSTWSEALFIFGLLWLSAAVYYFTQKKQSNLFLLNLFFSALFLFLSRYIGTCGFLFIALLSFFYLFKKDYKTFSRLLITSFVGFLFIGAYLLHNYLRTGILNGVQNLPPPETSYELLKLLLKACIIALNIFRCPYPHLDKFKFITWFLFEVGLLSFFFFKVKNYLYKDNNNEQHFLWRIFICFGLTYFTSVVFMHWIFYLANFYFRYITPAILLFIIGFISYVEFNYPPEVFKKLKVFLVLAFSISYLLNVPAIMIKLFVQNKIGFHHTYSDTVNDVKKLYSKMPSGTVIVCPSLHLDYLRTDLIGLSPLCRGYYSSKDESMQEFLERVNRLFPKKEVYFQIKNTDVSKYYHQTIREFIKKHQGKDFVKLK